MDILDRVVVSNTEPSMSQVEGQWQKKIEEKIETNFTIVTRNSDGNQCYHKDDHIKVDIQTPSGDELKTEIKDSKDGKYTVTYTPECVGQHGVEIEVNGQPLTGSPWNVQVVPHQYQFLFKFGSHGNGPGQFNNPFGIAVSREKTGTIAVADIDNKRIQLFSSDENYLREIGLEDKCGSVAFTKSGDVIAVAPDADHKISLFTESGQSIKHINDEHLKAPVYASVASDDSIVTCDWEDNEIRVISPDGSRLLDSFRVSEFDDSLNCAVYHQDTYFVCDCFANSIRVSSKEGKFLYNIGGEGSGDGQLNEPHGLAFDKLNNLIVCDTGNQRLQLFTLDGKFVTKIEQHFLNEGGAPGYVAVSNNGNVFVTDAEKHCVHVFQ